MSENPGGPRQIKAGAVLSYVVIVVHFAVAMVYTPIMLRLLGQAEYGLYSLVASIVGYLTLISFGFGGAYMRFYARYRVVEDWEGVRRLNGMFLIVFSAIGALAATAGTILTVNAPAVLGGQFSPEELGTASVLFAILTINLAITFPSSVFNSYVIAHERFIFQKSLQILRLLVSPLVILPILLLGHGSIGMAIATTVINLASTVYTITFAIRRLGMRFSLRGFDFALFREVSVFSGYLFINMVVDQINWNVDKFIIGRFHGAVPVAVYGIAAMLNSNYLTFSTALSGVLVPRVNLMVSAAESKRAISDLFVRVGRLQFIALGLVVSGFVFFGRPFIANWAGPSYTDAYYIGLFLLVPVTIPLIQNLGIEIQKAMNLHKFRSWVYFAVAAGNVLLSIPLTQRFSGMGAAAATAIALLIGNVLIMNWYYHDRVGLDIIDFWRQILRVSVGSLPALGIGVLLALVLDLHQIPLLLAGVSIYTAAYVAGMWLLGMNDRERRLFGSAVDRLRRRKR